MCNLEFEDQTDFINLFKKNVITDALLQKGFALINPNDFSKIVNISLFELNKLKYYWHNLPLDPYLKDGGDYRFRRHASYTIQNKEITASPYRAHWQSLEHNQLNGGIQRWYDLPELSLTKSTSWQRILVEITQLINLLNSAPAKWFVEAHQFRIDTRSGIGRPTPEGIHRDGADYVVIILVDRVGIKGGESHIFNADGSICLAKTLSNSWTLLIIDDTRMLHETTPITSSSLIGYRDSLVITYRRSGFQNPNY